MSPNGCLPLRPSKEPFGRKAPLDGGTEWGCESERPRPNSLILPTSSSTCQPQHARVGGTGSLTISPATLFLLHGRGCQIPGCDRGPTPSTPTPGNL